MMNLFESALDARPTTVSRVAATASWLTSPQALDLSRVYNSSFVLFDELRSHFRVACLLLDVKCEGSAQQFGSLLQFQYCIDWTTNELVVRKYDNKRRVYV